jgi:hypothetical protein
VLNGILEGEDTSLGLGLISHICILLSHPHHHSLVAGAADNGWKHSAGRIVTGEPGLAHTGTVVHNEGLNFIRHLVLIRKRERGRERKEKERRRAW